MIVTEENESYYLQAMRVDFLTESWEVDWYATALMQAAEWGRKVDKENRDYKQISNLYSNHIIK